MPDLNNKQADSGGWNEEDDGEGGANKSLVWTPPPSSAHPSSSHLTKGQKHRGPWWGLLDPPNNLIISAPD